MSDELFPSGPWVGFYTYQPRDRHRMDLHLDFVGGRMSGDGNDDVGRFLIRGRYDAASRECHWTKSYVGRHDVYYTGYREGKGIWGRWEINAFNHGGFHIWPRTAGEGNSDAQAEADSRRARGRHLCEGTNKPRMHRTPPNLMNSACRRLWTCDEAVLSDRRGIFRSRRLPHLKPVTDRRSTPPPNLMNPACRRPGPSGRKPLIHSRRVQAGWQGGRGRRGGRSRRHETKIEHIRIFA